MTFVFQSLATAFHETCHGQYAMASYREKRVHMDLTLRTIAALGDAYESKQTRLYNTNVVVSAVNSVDYETSFPYQSYRFCTDIIRHVLIVKMIFQEGSGSSGCFEKRLP